MRYFHLRAVRDIRWGADLPEDIAVIYTKHAGARRFHCLARFSTFISRLPSELCSRWRLMGIFLEQGHLMNCVHFASPWIAGIRHEAVEI